MKVRQLIKHLQKMPQGLEVYYSHHDNAEHETAGLTCSVIHHSKSDYENDYMSREDRECLESQPKEWVTIHG
jgi:hypothetical protein